MKKQNLDDTSTLMMIRVSIAKKKLNGEALTVREAMTQAYDKPCCRTIVGFPAAGGFGRGTLMILKNEVVVVQVHETENFYPDPGLRRSAVLEGSRFPGLLAGSRLVLGKRLITICKKARLKDERSLARIINRWI